MSKALTDAKMESFLEDILADTAALVAIPSISGNRAECLRAVDYVLQRAKSFGMRTFSTAERDVGVAEIGEGGSVLGILVHVDVVHPGDETKWTHPPYEMVRKNGFIWGRGVEDDKAPVMMCLYAMKALLDLALPLKKRIQLIVGSCEEVEWDDMAHYTAQFPCPDYAFSPDAAFPVYNGEHGYADVVLHFHEPHAAALHALAAGEAPNTIPSLATAQMAGGAAFEAQGKAAHSSTPHLADNAIEKLCRTAAPLKPFNFARFVNTFFGCAHPSKGLGIDDGTDVYGDETVGYSTVAPTVLRLEDARVMLNINLRHRYGVSKAAIETAFTRLAKTHGFTFQINNFQSPIRVPSTLAPFRLMDNVQQEYGLGSGFCTTAGTTYAKAMPNTVSWGPVLSEESGTAHVENERYSVDTLLIASKAYCQYLARMAETP